MKINNKKTSSKNKYYIHFYKPTIDIKDFEFYSFNKLNKIKVNSLSEIFIYDLLEYINITEVFETIKILISKLKNGGKLHIQCTDLKSLSLAVLDGQIDNNIFRSILFANNKKNIMSVNEIRKIIESYEGVVVNKIKFLNGLQFYVECQKYE